MVPYDEFERVMASCFDIFNTWDEGMYLLNYMKHTISSHNKYSFPSQSTRNFKDY